MASASSQPTGDPPEGILKMIMSLRGLSVSDESKFDFEPRETWKRWPGARYGQDSPHLQFAKGTKAGRGKHPSSPAKPSRPTKARKPKAVSPAKPKPLQPSTVHGVIPKRDVPLHLLTLPPELRNRIYELLAVHDEPLYPQLRPVWKTGGKRRACDIRRFPLEPSLSLANRQIREELLSIFYGSNRFVFKPSEQDLLQKYSMTAPLNLGKWAVLRSASRCLRHIEWKVKARRYIPGPSIGFKITKSSDGEVEITHDLDGSMLSYCPCLEDQAIAGTMVEARGETDLMRILQILAQQRQHKLALNGRWDEEKEMYERVPPTRCEHCEKRVIPYVGAG
ncbi:hypothetical protein LTR53_000684 [Teratosphaeriaceae sp. CCFEE 6253]|nr:hypothetical protein LTR53_000684 [Teratosphaeriaceae sp. CCFEE 6253]